MNQYMLSIGIVSALTVAMYGKNTCKQDHVICVNH